jgi:hypothetical protein
MAVAKKETPAEKSTPVKPAAKPAFSDADEFADLLGAAVIEPRRTGTKDRYLPADQIPTQYTELAKKLHAEKTRIKLPVTDEEKYKKLHTLFSSAAHHLGLSATVRSEYDGDGEDAKMVRISITVGDERKTKKGAAADAEKSNAEKIAAGDDTATDAEK